MRKFDQYVAFYIEKGDFRYQLKKDHTYRVVELCDQIASNLDFSSSEIEIAKLCGLLHDIARFEQVRRYDIFSEPKSYDHGDLGVELLQENHLLRRFCPMKEWDHIILDAVKYHNKLKVPDTLDEKVKKFVHILRDADKIDILNLILKEEYTIDIKDELISDHIFSDLIKHRLIDKAKTVTRADEICIWFGLLFDFHYPYSVQILKEKDYIAKIIDLYQKKSQNPKTRERLSDIKKIVTDYMQREEA